MKTSKLTLIYLAMLVSLIGVFLASPQSVSAQLIAEQVKIEPKPIDLDNADDITVYVKLMLNGVPVVTQINASTVLLEGALAPREGSNRTTKVPPEFSVQFDGYYVALMIWAKISHLGITTPKPWVPVKIPLKITGLLYDGTPWEGTGEAKVLIPDVPPPQP